MKTTESKPKQQIYFKFEKQQRRSTSSHKAFKKQKQKHILKEEIGMIQVILCGQPPQITTWGFGILGQRNRRQKVLVLQLRTSKEDFFKQSGATPQISRSGAQKASPAMAAASALEA